MFFLERRFTYYILNFPNLQVVTTAITLEEKIGKTIMKATSEDILSNLQKALEGNVFNVTVQKDLKKRLSRLLLYHILFPEEFDVAKDFLMLFREKVPQVISSNEEFMDLLCTIAKRIECMQIPRYEKLQKFLLDFVKKFVVAGSHDCETISTSAKVALRDGVDLKAKVNLFHGRLLKIPGNELKISQLLSKGYDSSLWTDNIEIKVETSGRLNLEENTRQTLLSLYQEYVQLLQQLGIPHIHIDGKNIAIGDIFSDEHSLAELKGRRAITVKVVCFCLICNLLNHVQFYIQNILLVFHP